MSTLKEFEEATLWRPTLRPVRTTDEHDCKGGSSVAPTTKDSCTKCCSSQRLGVDSPSGYPSINDPQYRTDNFMMYGFKIALCSRTGRHRWDDCPFAHPTENARRRDPRIFSYSCQECPSYRNAGYCPRGDQCEFSHGIFEARLHPDSYRTQACKDGKNCKRKICFFYHNEEERRIPTGLHEARAQIAAELGDSAFEMSGDTLRAVANSLLTTSPSLSSTMQSLNSAFSQPLCQTQTFRSGLSMGNTSPLAVTTPSGPNTPSISAALSGLSIGGGNSGILKSGNSGLLMTSDTIAPCLKGANKNKALVRELAKEVGLHADSLMNSLRVAALQGELTAQSLASTAPYGTFNTSVEGVLEDISDAEDVPLDKLRGWLVRQTTHCSSPHPRAGTPRAGTPTDRASASPMFSATFSPRIQSDSPEDMARFSFASIRNGTPGLATPGLTTPGLTRASPSPRAGADMQNMGPVLPPSHDEVIRAFNSQEELQPEISIKKKDSNSWRSSNHANTPRANASMRRNGSGDGRWRGSANDARW